MLVRGCEAVVDAGVRQNKVYRVNKAGRDGLDSFFTMSSERWEGVRYMVVIFQHSMG